MRLAVFDIDGTLVAGPSTEKRLFLELLRTGRLPPRRLAAFLWFALRWLPAYGRHVFKKDKAYLAGFAQAELRVIAGEWVRREVAGHWFEPCVARLRQHQACGDRVALVSGTPDFLAAAIADALGVDTAIGTRCAVSEGRLLPAPPDLHPFAGAKVAIVADLCDQYGLTAAEVVAYADSVHDVPLLRMAGRAVAVRPDAGLTAVARAAGWEILGERRADVAGTARRTPIS